MPISTSAGGGTILGILIFSALVLLIALVMLVNQRGRIRQHFAVDTLRRSVKAHEIGIYNGIYGR